MRGINAYLARNLKLSGVAINGADTIGLLVNGSTVSATGLNVHGDVGVWGSVEVDPGAAVENTPSAFTVDEASILGDDTQIWSDGANISNGNDVTVDAAGYDVYHVNDTDGQPLLRIWSKGPLARPGAYILEADGVREFYGSVQSALDGVATDGTVVVTGSPVLASQVTVRTAGVTIDGGGHTVATKLDNSLLKDPNNNSVFGVQNVSGVTIKNLTIDASGGKNVRGLNAFRAGVLLSNMTITGSDRMGLLVNGSDVTANGLRVNNNAWGSVEVDSGLNVAEPSTFTVDAASSLRDSTQIWSDGVNVNSGATTVNAPGYDVYHVNDTEGQAALRIWAKGPLDRPGAYVLDAGGIREFYSSIPAAITAAGNGTVYVTQGDYTSVGTVTVDRDLTIEGAPAGKTWKNLKFDAASGDVAVHNFAFDATTTPIVTANSSAVDATHNYWGSAEPEFAAVVSGDVTYSPWYIDPSMQVSIDEQTPFQQASISAGAGVTDYVDGAQAAAIGTSGTVTLVALPTTTAGSGIPSTGLSTAPTKVIDVSVSGATGITIILVTICDVAGATNLLWYDGTAWQAVVGQPLTGPDASGCLTVTLTRDSATPKSSPTVEQLTGTVFAAVKRVSTPGGGGVGGVGDGSGSTIPPTDTASRLAGSDRYATAGLIAEQFVKADAAYSGAVVLANGENFKQGLDALSANYLAGAQHAPILLTQAGSLPAATVTGLRAVLADQVGATIYVMGSSDSVSDAVVAQAKKIAEAATGGSVTVTRVAGSDRFATSAASATSSGTVGSVKIGSGADAKTAILASGEVNADALAAGSLSFAAHLPVLLTQAGSLPLAVQDAITKLGIKQVIVLGGTDRVSAAVVKALAAIGVTSVTRIAGADRFDTAARIYRFARSNSGVGIGGSKVYLANGITGFPDALAVGPLAGATGSSVLTVSGTSLPTSTKQFLTSYKSILTSVVPLGADATVAQSIVDAARAALG